MFEKELEEYKNQSKWKGKIFMKDEETCFKDGAEFGYNKAKEELEEENAELKEQCSNLADCNTCHSTCKNENIEMKKQLTKAKEIIKDYMIIVKSAHITVCGVSEENRTINVLKLNKEAEQFIKDSDFDLFRAYFL